MPKTSSAKVKKLQEDWANAEYKMLCTKLPQINWNNSLNLRRCRYNVSIGLLSIGALLQANGLTVEYIDDQLQDDLGNWESEILHIGERACLVGITAMTANSNRALTIVDKIRNTNPHVPIVLGGCHFSYVPDIALQRGAIAVVDGPGEVAMLELAKCFLKGRNDCSDIKGLYLKNDTGRVEYSGPRYEYSIEKLPPIDFKILPMQMKNNCEVYIFSGRGCTHRCAFCSEGHFWRQIYRRPINDVITEVESHNRVIGADIVFLNDSSFGSDVPLTKELCSALRKRFPDMFLRCMVRADAVTEDLVKVFSEYGVIDIQIGIESGCDEILKKLNKGETVSDYIRALRLLRPYVPVIRSSWMVGCPGDNHLTLNKSLSFMENLFLEGLLDEATVRIFVPYPGTAIFKNPAKYRISIRKYRGWHEFDRRFEKPVISTESLNSQQIFDWYVKFAEKIVTLMEDST